MKNTDYQYKLLILFVGILVFVLNLGQGTVDIMEARNFVTVREMLESGNWLMPTMNGALRLAKPPLPTWITAVFASVFGLKSLFFLRLPAVLMSIWSLFSMNVLVKRITKDSLLGVLSAVALSGMLYVVLLGRRGTWDIYTHSFMLAGIAQFVAIFQTKKPFFRAVLGGIFFGLAFLSKGPVALYALFLPFLIAYFWSVRPLFSKKIILALFVYFIVGAVISCSWFLYIHFFWSAESQQVLGREIQNWTSYNVRPFWYYLKDYPAHSGIWAVILMIGLWGGQTCRKWENRKHYQLFWLWTVGSVLLLSVIPEKKIRYLFPTFIPASFLVARYFCYLIRDFDTSAKKIDRFLFYMNWGLFVLVAIAFPFAVYFLIYQKGIMEVETLIALCGMLVLCLFFLQKSLQKGQKQYFLVGIMGLLVSAVLFVFPYTDNLANREYNSIEKVQEFEQLKDLPCYALEETRIELVWLVGRKIKEVQTLDNLQPPYLLLTNKPPQTYALPSFECVGHYDNNSKKRGHKHHHESLSKYVSVVH
ncbi:MAG: glycosyltransferase family 39 protein [Flavobacteriaceae bacterium]|nr:glycosyltransferase family 39 protein [Flavobacteriaceae bacterium]